jgi:hypothetical protein
MSRQPMRKLSALAGWSSVVAAVTLTSSVSPPISSAEGDGDGLSQSSDNAVPDEQPEA